jgi:hypothetical protein
MPCELVGLTTLVDGLTKPALAVEVARGPSDHGCGVTRCVRVLHGRVISAAAVVKDTTEQAQIA